MTARLGSSQLVVAFSAALVLGVIWEFAAHHYETIRYLLSAPTLIARYAVESWADLLVATAVTGAESIVGLVLAIAGALALVVAGLYSTRVYRWILPIAVISQVIPLVSLAPFFILAFGFGFAGKVAMATTMCFFPILVNAVSGVRSISPSTRDLLYVYAVARQRAIFTVLLPLALPSLFAGVRISVTLAVIGAIVAEFNGAERGLGKNLFLAAKRLEPELMMTSLILSSFLGGLLYLAANQLESRIGHWYIFSHRAQP